MVNKKKNMWCNDSFRKFAILITTYTDAKKNTALWWKELFSEVA